MELAGGAGQPALGALDAPGVGRKRVAAADFDVQGGRVGRGEDELDVIVGIAQGEVAFQAAVDGGFAGAK